MKFILGIITLLLFTTQLQAQMVATVQMKKKIEGICDKKAVYSLFPSFGDQVKAKCPKTKDEIAELINDKVQYLKDNTKFSKKKCMLNTYVSCEGKMVSAQIDHSTGEDDLDAALIKVFSELGEWTAGKLNGKQVDSLNLWSFHFKNGQFAFDY
jgi:hypothetical protein